MKMVSRFILSMSSSISILLHGTQCTGEAIDSKVINITVDWSHSERLLQTTPTLQVVVNPLLRRESPIHDILFQSLRDLDADYVRFVPWHPYPRLGVAELYPPVDGKTSWNFNLIDPLVLDFFSATEGRARILNFSTAPAWIYKTDTPVPFPDDPDRVTWQYVKGNELRDPTMQELVGYYTRLVNWYTKGGFVDERGVQHISGFHFEIPFWEVFNEIDMEHKPTPEQYAAEYDAIVLALHGEHPEMKFVGLALAFEQHPEDFEYFLNHNNHKANVPLDMISYHFYASPTRTQTVNEWQYTFFDEADRFLSNVRYIEAIRKRLSPETRTTLDEVGSILPTDWHPDTPYNPGPMILKAYWALSGATYAYVFLEAAKIGIDVVGESQLLGFESQFPSVTLIDPNTGTPNARFLVLKLLKDHLSAGDKMVETHFTGVDIDAQAFGSKSSRRLLISNKRNLSIQVNLSNTFKTGNLYLVDEDGHVAKKPESHLSQGNYSLPPFSVSVVESKE